MAEDLKVRVVRCPKCENLLPELPHFSVYQCGGCGTVLQAKKNAPVTDDLSERSIEEKVIDVSEKLDNITGEQGLDSLVNVPETEIVCDKIDLDDKEHQDFEEIDVNSVASPSLITQNQETFDDSDRFKGRETIDTQPSEPITGEQGLDSLVNVPKTEIGCDKIDLDDKELRDFEEFNVNSVASPSLITQNQETFDDSDRFKGRETIDTQPAEPITDSKDVGLGNRREKSSNNPLVSPVHGKGNDVNLDKINLSDLEVKNEPRKIMHPNSFLRSREIKYQWGMERDVSPKFVEEHNKGHLNYPPGYVNAHDDHMKNHNYINVPQKVENLERDRAELRRKLDELKDQLIRSCNVVGKPQEIYDDERMVPPNPYLNYSHGHAPYLNVHDIDMHNFYPPPRQAPIDYRYEDYFRPQIMRIPHHQPSSSSSQYQSASSYNNYRNWQGPSQSAYSDFRNRRFQEDPTSNFYDNVDVDPINFGPRYNPRDIDVLQSHSHYPQPHKRSPSDFNLNFPARTHYRPRRVYTSSHGNTQIFRPLASGAPFLTCYNCLQLLKIPRKIMLMKKNKKLQCSACETIILFEEQNKGLVVSYPTLTDSIRVETNHSLLNEDSPDFGISSFKSESTDTEANFLPANVHDCYDSSCSISSEEKLSPNSKTVHKDISSLDQLSLKVYLSPPFSQSPIKDISSNHEAVSTFENGNKSNRINQDDVNFNKGTSRHIIANEIEDPVKEDRLLKSHTGSKFFLGSFIKKGFKDFARSSQHVDTVKATSNVSVNGQPLPNRVVEKAAKLAGPIQPGKYWYDFRAGFWGVMGQPCHGIIPPFIEEFDYPMPEKCGAGNTDVYVNGRELYQKDLDLLVRRGLPSTRNKYYIVEISGIVIDEESGQELDNLGKLAPTVEKNGKGFGMRVPQVIM